MNFREEAQNLYPISQEEGHDNRLNTSRQSAFVNGCHYAMLKMAEQQNLIRVLLEFISASKEGAQISSDQRWEKINVEYPNGVNPHAFALGYREVILELREKIKEIDPTLTITDKA